MNRSLIYGIMEPSEETNATTDIGEKNTRKQNKKRGVIWILLPPPKMPAKKPLSGLLITKMAAMEKGQQCLHHPCCAPVAEKEHRFCSSQIEIRPLPRRPSKPSWNGPCSMATERIIGQKLESNRNSGRFGGNIENPLK
jgi:hypothetical protein